MRPFFPMALFAASLSLAALPAVAQVVKVTPLGSHAGEFCPLDRALVFEDPDGSRILYDAGRDRQRCGASWPRSTRGCLALDPAARAQAALRELKRHRVHA